MMPSMLSCRYRKDVAGVVDEADVMGWGDGVGVGELGFVERYAGVCVGGGRCGGGG